MRHQSIYRLQAWGGYSSRSPDGVAEHQLPVHREGGRAVAEQLIVKRPLRILRALLLLVVPAQLQQHQLADRVDEIGRIERAALGLAPRAALLHETSRRGRTACPAPPTSLRRAAGC